MQCIAFAYLSLKVIVLYTLVMELGPAIVAGYC